VFDKGSVEVPRSVLDAKATLKAKKHDTLIRFFDKRHSWSVYTPPQRLATPDDLFRTWVSPENIQPLGKDEGE
jgi:hypothetical protein